MKWVPGEPTNKNGTENCLSIKKSKMNITGFNDIKCVYHQRFFCQKSKNPAKNLKTSKACVEVSTQVPNFKPSAKELDLQSQLTVILALEQDLENELEMEKSNFRKLQEKLRDAQAIGFDICKDSYQKKVKLGKIIKN